MLDIQLKEMVEDDLVVKTIYPELPPRSEYRISELSKSLLPIIDMMLRWGEDHFEVFVKNTNRNSSLYVNHIKIRIIYTDRDRPADPATDNEALPL